MGSWFRRRVTGEDRRKCQKLEPTGRQQCSIETAWHGRWQPHVGRNGGRHLIYGFCHAVMRCLCMYAWRMEVPSYKSWRGHGSVGGERRWMKEERWLGGGWQVWQARHVQAAQCCKLPPHSFVL